MRWDKSRDDTSFDNAAKEFLGLAEEGYEALINRAYELSHGTDRYGEFLYVHIKSYVGEKAIQRHLMKKDRGWTDQQFEDWWDSFNRR